MTLTVATILATVIILTMVVKYETRFGGSI